MKNVQLKILALCVAISGSLGAMENTSAKEVPTVKVGVWDKSTTNGWFEVIIPITEKEEQTNDATKEAIERYFKLGSNEGTFDFSRAGNQCTLKLDSGRYCKLNNMRTYKVDRLIGAISQVIATKQPIEEIDSYFKETKGWADTPYGRSILKASIKNYFNQGGVAGCLDGMLLHFDKMVDVIEGAPKVSGNTKRLWREIVKTVDEYFYEGITEFLDKKMLVQDLPEYVQKDPDLHFTSYMPSHYMQFLIYAFKHARKDSAQPSRIIGSWFEQKMASLKPEELDRVIQNVQLWLAHYKPVENHLVQMRYGAASSWMNKAVLKKTGIGLFLFGLGVVASQLYQRMYSASAQEESSAAQA